MVSSRNKVHYSRMETAMLKMLNGGRRISSEELTDRVYKDEVRPFNARNSVTSIMSSLIRKAEHNREPFKIVKSTQGGPVSTEYQKVER